jgi:quercetin dioxygenase-like cupin family protein
VSRLRFDNFRWEGIEPRPYKEGSGDFKGIVRHRLGGGDAAGFELRYFELERGGYSSLEKHRHVHFVIALRGAGKALVGSEVVDLEPFDAVYVPPLTADRFINAGQEPFGFLCPVDAERDLPQPLDDAELEALRANPATAPYVP